MKRKYVLGFAAAIIIVGVVLAILQADRVKEAFSPATSVWQDRADEAQAEFTKSFWDDKRGLFNNAAPCIAQLCSDPFNYWWLAHVVDVLVDGYERTEDSAYTDRLAKLYQGLLDRNAGVMINDYYDDMEWMALAWLRAYDATKDERYKSATLELWTEIKTGWNDEMGGGIAWRKEQLDYKNTPANAPAVILAARLYRRFGDEADLAWAKKIYDWQKKNLVDPNTGLVWDGMNRMGDSAIDKDWKFTYGQGVYIGAGVELYHATKEAGYLDDACRTAANLKTDFLSPATGMLPSEGDGDGGLFKGVLVRYLGELIEADPEQQELIELLQTNADSLWEYGKSADSALLSNSWAQTPDAVVQMSTQLSGMMLLEQMAKLEK
ncbi:putative alpha-1,6-mannanase (GH76 family) [Paenibacillus phyllosphaerae]|uniref:Putative alpha-1,6-mannanase (GH76 family) n=1 Tax=Paenibacillus phyllosphaerae TaxID=274593 RepID=A0A7W5FPS4_9BACL|nr:glycoside hydrolase family 76 protein [Paenibacillus phyllosphaerae]MBB3112690.1 putative alpha-1,6-mannanase (GH76 family) [Paenibacillus phyllosphaerae]